MTTLERIRPADAGEATAPPLGSPTLLLIPTRLEQDRFLDHGGLGPGLALQAICGFGPVAAAARTSQLLAQLNPRRVLLIGIAGAYDPERHPVGTALEFSAVACDGVGAGEGPGFRGPPALGFPQWPGSGDTTPSPVEDRIELCASDGAVDAGLLLTTCAASDSEAQAALRLERFPDAVAEDMEGFAVAMACALHRVPLRIVRGISNRVGDRQPSNWRIPAALAAARRLAGELLAAGDWPARPPRTAGPAPAPR